MKRPDDSGVTLVELVLATAITGLLGAVIAAAFFVGVKTTDTANTRIATSRGAQFAAAIFPGDVQSAMTITTSGTPCSGASPNVAQLQWQELNDAGTLPVTTKVAEWTCRTTGGVTELIRRLTVGGIIQSEIVIARDVSTAAVSCDPGCATPTSATMTATAGDLTFVVVGQRRSQ